MACFSIYDALLDAACCRSLSTCSIPSAVDLRFLTDALAPLEDGVMNDVVGFVPWVSSFAPPSRVREILAELGRRLSFFPGTVNVARLVPIFRTEEALLTNALFIGAAFTGPVVLLRTDLLARLGALFFAAFSLTVASELPKLGLPVECFDDGLLTDEKRRFSFLGDS